MISVLDSVFEKKICFFKFHSDGQTTGGTVNRKRAWFHWIVHRKIVILTVPLVVCAALWNFLLGDDEGPGEHDDDAFMELPILGSCDLTFRAVVTWIETP